MRLLLPALLSLIGLAASAQAPAAPDSALGEGAWAEIGTPMRIIDAVLDSARAANQQDRQRRLAAAGAPPEWPQIVAAWQARAKREPALAQRRLGELQLTGQGLPSDEARAFEQLTQAAALGDRRAAVLQAALVLSGRVASHDQDDAALLALQTASKAGDTLAMLVLGQTLVEGRTQGRDLVQAARLFRGAAARGDPLAQVAWARAQLFGLGTAVNVKAGMASLAKAAATGHPTAQLMFAMGQIHGVGRPRDVAAGQAVFRRMAQAGVAQAQSDLAAQLLQGAGGLPPDVPQALAWWDKAAAQGWARAHYLLAVVYRDGAPGLEPDLVKSFAHARQGAELGDSTAQVVLGELLSRGEGTQ